LELPIDAPERGSGGGAGGGSGGGAAGVGQSGSRGIVSLRLCGSLELEARIKEEAAELFNIITQV
jgi:hypothetical protein